MEDAAFDAVDQRRREPGRRGGIAFPAGIENRIAERLHELGVPVREYPVDIQAFRRFLIDARYESEFPEYYPTNRSEKSLEHFIAADLLELSSSDIYIDIASEHSPAPTIYNRLFGPTAYRQDLSYPAGFDGDKLGGDAAAMPIPPAFASKMALHCSFEHFESDADTRFVREASRVLKPGGAVCIVPLYLYEYYAVYTDPAVAAKETVRFDSDAIVHGVEGWGNRHGRFYDPEHLIQRVVEPARQCRLEPFVYQIVNYGEVDPSCYARFAMLLRKRH